MSRVRSEKIPSFPGLEEAKPTCAAGLLPHVGWIECRVRFPKAEGRTTLEVQKVFLFVFLVY